jgi:predicted ATPase
MAIRQGDAKGGVDGLQSSLQRLHAAPYELLTTEFNLSLSWGFSAIGRFAEAIALIDETMRLVEANGDLLYMPEVLRMRGSILLSMPQPSVDEAEACFMQSLELSRRQGARAWELRTAVDLAKQWVAQGRFEDARALLQPVFEQFTERLDTADLKAAERLLATSG